MKDLKIQPGEEVSYQGSLYRIRKVVDLKNILAENSIDGKLLTIPINSIKSVQETIVKTPSIDQFTEKELEEAKRKLEILQPILRSRGDGKVVSDQARIHKLSIATVYRWLEKYTESESIVSLVESRGKVLRGKKKINDEVEEIIKQAIEETYNTRQKKKAQKVIQQVQGKCRQLKITVPHENTIRNRIKEINEFESLKKREGLKIARQRHDPSYGEYKEAEYPLHLIQIDHTQVDIILVDDINRIPIGRPWITLAIDIHSRMIPGYYLSFDKPNFLSVGLCIAHAILPKEKWLLNAGVDGEWPCWGRMTEVHCDNAKEFHSKSMERSCLENKIAINFRPTGKSNWGGHIERLLGTFKDEIHALPGTTFSNPKERGDYKSEKNAVMTLKEFERWLLTFIVNVYHRRKHEGIGMAPVTKYEQGIIGTESTPGVGLQPRIMDEYKLKIDFLPRLERTVQDYGVMIEHIHYYSDVLKKWVNKTDPTSGKAQLKRKFIFKYDPRDMSCVHFFDPELKEYFQIPYRDLSKPPITLWEFKAVKKKLKEDGIKHIDEDKIFEAYEKMRVIEEEATSKAKRARMARSVGRKANSDNIVFQKTPKFDKEEYDQIDISSLRPFE
jgi:putative transposase